VKYIGHLDMARTWQRIARRAHLPLAYSEGFNPQPRLSFARRCRWAAPAIMKGNDMVLSPPCAISEVKANLERARCRRE
jgi:radical SAM-linked protein